MSHEDSAFEVRFAEDVWEGARVIQVETVRKWLWKLAMVSGEAITSLQQIRWLETESMWAGLNRTPDREGGRRTKYIGHNHGEGTK